MLFVLFQLGDDRYALDASRLLEVLPLVRLKQIPQAPRGIAGAFNYHGQPTPAVDLCALALGRPAQLRLSTRLLVVRDGHGADERPLGLIAERSTETMRRAPEDFVAPGVTAPQARYLGPVVTDAQGALIQRVDVDGLLNAEVRATLFRDAAAAVEAR